MNFANTTSTAECGEGRGGCHSWGQRGPTVITFLKHSVSENLDPSHRFNSTCHMLQLSCHFASNEPLDMIFLQIQVWILC